MSIGADSAAAGEELYDRVYDELKRMARAHRRRTDRRTTLSTTELVHEAFLKLGADDGKRWQGKAHFFGAASRAMRQVLVDFARRRRAAKRGGIATRVSLRDGDATLEVQLDEIIAIDEALNRLDAVDERLRQIVELRFFAGFGEREVADLLGVTPRTVERNWLKARLLLLRELDSGDGERGTGNAGIGMQRVVPPPVPRPPSPVPPSPSPVSPSPSPVPRSPFPD
ncbi:MAG TPA: ECF-type sigma factor [Gemmatimonadaceae bacterium]|jgi:RNA polymerase sigma factor (TIGR02999 family)|nr:ECF-type sigma factor [Gemmatimonadaceae bacterium]